MKSVDQPTRTYYPGPEPDGAHEDVGHSRGEVVTMDSLIAGQRAVAERYVHTIHADALLTDAFTWITRKRNLDRGTDTLRVEDTAVVGRTALATCDQVELAISAGKAAASEWAARPAADHREFLTRANRALRINVDRIVDLLVAEGHPRRLAQWEMDGVLKGSSKATREFCESLTGGSQQLDGSTITLRRRPTGLVGVVPSQNAAASTSLLGMTALAAGNAVMVKPPRSSPFATAWVWQELIQPQLEAVDAPLGTLSVVCAPPQATLDRWISPDGVDCLFFVGGSERGMRLSHRCMENGIRPVLELSGNDSLVVWKDADVDAAARSAVECFYGSAQICMVPKRVAVHPDVADEFLARVVERSREIRPGLPSDPEVLLSPVLDPMEFSQVLGEALDGGAELLSGGRILDHEGREDIAGVFVEPTVLRFRSAGGSSPACRAIDEETFFPLLPVTVWEPAPDNIMMDQMIRFTNGNRYGLRNSLWTGSRATAQRWLDRVGNGGILKINCSHIGFSEVLPTHGGTGWSGGVFGEANYPALTTTRLQAIQISNDYWGDDHA